MKKFLILLSAGTAFALASCASTKTCCGSCDGKAKTECCGTCGGDKAKKGSCCGTCKAKAN